MSCTAADLINIQPLVLSDTFNTWFDRTNEIIETASAINVFDVAVGPTNGGLIRETGCSGGYYNGVVTISVNPGAGIGIGVPAFTNNYNKVIIDAIRLEDLGTGASANPAIDDYVIFSDLSDQRQGSAGTPKRTTANRMLPNTVVFGDSGNGDFTIQGNVTIVGNLNVQDDISYIDSNDLRIEDKLIELAYARYVQFTISGSSLTGTSFDVGSTAFYHDTINPPTEANATTIGLVSNWSVSPSGTTGTIRLGAFSEGGVGDIIATGKLVVTGTAYQQTVTVSGDVVDGTDFYSDTLLQPAGVRVKGLQGDKDWVWLKSAPIGSVDWYGFFSNTNIGVTGSDNYIVSSKFASYGYGAADNTYTYYGSSDSFTKYQVGEQLSMFHSATGAAGITFGVVYSGSTGPAVYPSVPVTNWVKWFNADQLDGAHALTTATPWSIPVSLDDGRLHEDWIRADAIRKRFCQTGHAFQVGHVLRFDLDGSLTFAQANTVPNAEAIGMVESVTGNCFSLVTKGFIKGLTGSGGLTGLYPLATGQAYYLHPDVGGRLISNPDGGAYEVQAGEVRKAIFLATGYNSGYVINYTGVIVGDTPSDLVYLRSVAPIGAVQPFAGAVDQIPDGWLLCDGKAKSQNEWNDLYSAIGQNHHADATVYDASTITIDGDTRGLAVGDALQLVWTTGSASVIVATVTEATRRVSFVSSPFTEVLEDTEIKVYGRSVGSTVGRSVFFLPDMRRRTAFGVSNGTGLSGSGVISPAISLGTVGGDAEVTLLENNIPPHTHSLNRVVQTDQFSTSYGSSTAETGGLQGTGVEPSPFNIYPPYVGLHWIIRSKKGLQATILTGHNHDNYYIRYDINHTTAGGAARSLTEADRTQFRTNARVLRRDADDTFHGTLTVTGNINIQGLGGADSVDAIVAGGVSADYYVGNRLFINESARITLTGSNSLMITGSSTSNVRMYPALNFGLTGPTGYYDQNQRDEDSRNLVIDYKTGEVSTRPLYAVSTTGPSNTTNPPATYPEGFMWYRLGTALGGEVGGLLSSFRYSSTTPTDTSPVGTIWYQSVGSGNGGFVPNANPQATTLPPAKGRWIFYRHVHWRDDNWDYTSFRVGNGTRNISGVSNSGSIAFHPRQEVGSGGALGGQVSDRILWIKVSETG
jgi:microcystin-dependent protein